MLVHAHKLIETVSGIKRHETMVLLHNLSPWKWGVAMNRKNGHWFISSMFTKFLRHEKRFIFTMFTKFLKREKTILSILMWLHWQEQVPIQVHRSLAYSDGIRPVEPARMAVAAGLSEGLLFTELDRYFREYMYVFAIDCL